MESQLNILNARSLHWIIMVLFWNPGIPCKRIDFLRISLPIRYSLRWRKPVDDQGSHGLSKLTTAIVRR